MILFYLIFALHCILTVDIISTTDKKVELAKIFLNDDFLPWVDSAKHVGNTMERDNSFTVDIRNKRGCFIGRIHSILQEVHFANPLVKMELISLYASSFYGSALWKLFDGPCDKLYAAWNNAVREAFDIPITSHRFFIEEVSGHLHPMVMLSSRFVKFHETLQKSEKVSIRYLSELCSSNLRTYYAQNLRSISECVNTAVEDLKCKQIKDDMKYMKVPDDQKWRAALVKDLLEVRWNTLEIDVVNDDLEDIDEVIEALCVS